jgi:hypothetical protein
VPLLSAPEPKPGDADLSLPCFVPDAGESASSRAMVPERPPRPRLAPERGPPRLMLAEVVELVVLEIVAVICASRVVALALGSSVGGMGLGVSGESSGRSSRSTWLVVCKCKVWGVERLTVTSPAFGSTFALVGCFSAFAFFFADFSFSLTTSSGSSGSLFLSHVIWMF